MHGWRAYALSAVGLAVLTGAVGWLLAHNQGRAWPVWVDPDWSVRELIGRLHKRLPDLYLIAARADGELCAGAYLCEFERDREELEGMPRNPACAGQWSGVVFCERVAPSYPLVGDDWGENGLTIGPFHFFGDAKLLAHIRDVLG